MKYEYRMYFSNNRKKLSNLFQKALHDLPEGTFLTMSSKSGKPSRYLKRDAGWEIVGKDGKIFDDVFVSSFILKNIYCGWVSLETMEKIERAIVGEKPVETNINNKQKTGHHPTESVEKFKLRRSMRNTERNISNGF